MAIYKLRAGTDLSLTSLQKGCCCYSVTQSCLTLCDPVDCRTLGSPVLHYLPGFAQIHIHIKPSLSFYLTFM